MTSEFDRFFSLLPDCMKRHEDGALTADTEHPAVQQLIIAIQMCRDAGDSEEVILDLLNRGVAEGERRRQEAANGR